MTARMYEVANVVLVQRQSPSSMSTTVKSKSPRHRVLRARGLCTGTALPLLGLGAVQRGQHLPQCTLHFDSVELQPKVTDNNLQRGDPYGDDIYTEPQGDPNTLENLGPLAALAGIWEGRKGIDQHPVVDGLESNEFLEHYELQPIDRQTNGPQLFYGLRYHTHIVKPGEVETFHDQVGFWLWEPADELVTFTLAIPRGQTLLAAGHARPDAKEFVVRATRGSTAYGILSNPFLERAFRTLSFEMHVSVDTDGTWSYEETTVLELANVEGPFAHTDRNTLTRIAPPSVNPLAKSAPTWTRSVE
ncbi:MAG TPA: heme-binding beta-barrel domain-containing protein [Acidimicrobiales bacterium]|nr:heme-binding beta-barrel domain-containing protein [Acidimicrobiales bacterium]